MRYLVITAHPDDVDFGAGGTVATLTAGGDEVVYCITTNGDAGGFDPAVPRSEIGGIRQREQRAAAEVLGVSDVRYLGRADGSVEVTIDLRIAFARVIREVQPDRVITHCPERTWERIGFNHPDHIAVGETVLRAVYPDARNEFAYMDRLGDLPPHTVAEVWLMGGPDPDLCVDVTGTFDRKIAALHRHVSQEVDRGGELEGRLRAWLGAQGAAHGLGEGRLGEVFRRIETA